MSNFKDQAAILDKLGIERLNAMQLEAHEAIHSNPEVVLLSPTGTGKTLVRKIFKRLSSDRLVILLNEDRFRQTI